MHEHHCLLLEAPLDESDEGTSEKVYHITEHQGKITYEAFTFRKTRHLVETSYTVNTGKTHVEFEKLCRDFIKSYNSEHTFCMYLWCAFLDYFVASENCKHKETADNKKPYKLYTVKYQTHSPSFVTTEPTSS